MADQPTQLESQNVRRTQWLTKGASATVVVDVAGYLPYQSKLEPIAQALDSCRLNTPA